ncbi:MAG: nuclear transport factor 2 family protein [Ignavibacteria bacterium]
MQKRNLNEIVQELNALIKQCRFEEALDEFYDQNVVTQENEDATTEGIEVLKTADRKFKNNVTGFTAEPLNSIINDDMSVTEWQYKFDHKIMGSWCYKQLSLQRWKDGKVIHERHHYKTSKW